jgi:hypothetical protein
MSTSTPATYTGAAATAPAGYGVAVTLSDSEVIPMTRALYVGVGGNIKVTDINGDVTYANVATGCVFPIQVSKVFATGTTASSIVALY